MCAIPKRDEGQRGRAGMISMVSKALLKLTGPSVSRALS